MVGGLELGRRDVAAGPVEPLGIPPSDPGRGRELDLVDRAPGTPRADELGLVQAVDALGEGIVVGVPLAPDRGDRPSSARRSVYRMARPTHVRGARVTPGSGAARSRGSPVELRLG